MIKWLKGLFIKRADVNIVRYSFDKPNLEYGPINGDIWMKSIPGDVREVDMYFFADGEWEFILTFTETLETD